VRIERRVHKPCLAITNLLPLYISEMAKARDFKFGVLLERRACEPKNAKVGQ